MRILFSLLAPLTLLAACATSQGPATSNASAEQMAGWVGKNASVAVETWGQPVFTMPAEKGTKKWGPGALKTADPAGAKTMVWFFLHSHTGNGLSPCDPTWLASNNYTTLDQYHHPCNVVRAVWVSSDDTIYNWRAEK